jgi:hypothetical protein
MSSSLEQLQLFFSISPALFILLALAVTAFAAFIYRRTNPIVSRFLRITLTALRTSALVLMLIVLFEATLHLSYTRLQRPILAVAIDQSASMALTDGAGSRQKTLFTVLHSPGFEELQRKFDLKYYLFANQVAPVVAADLDSIRFSGDETNLQNALEKISLQNDAGFLLGIVLLSDGSYTRGGNPVRFAEELGVPVDAVGIGSPAPVADLAITKVEANPFAYVGQATPVHLSVHSSGFGALSLPVTLTTQAAAVVTSQLNLPVAPSDAEVTLNFTPEVVGRQKIDISVPVQANERSSENNKRTIYIDILKSKLAILMIAGSVTPDITFFKKHLTTDRYDFRLLDRKSTGVYYQPLPTTAELNDIDLFIFYDFPTRDANPLLLRNLQESLKTRAKPLLLICGANTSPAELNMFSDFIPLEKAVNLQEERLAYPELSLLGASHAVMQIHSDLSATRASWRALPPLFSSLKIRSLMPGSEVLAYQKQDIQSADSEPLIVVRTNGAQKSAAIFAHELWRWDLMLKALDGRDEALAPLLDNLVHWLEMFHTDDLVHAETDKSNYSFGDPVSVNVTVFNEKLQLVSDARVDLVLQGKDKTQSQSFSAQAVGNGRYSCTVQPPQPGDYQLQATAGVQDRQIGTATTLFSVGEYSAELAELPAQLDVLKNLARVSGGVYVTPDSISSLAERLPGALIKTPVNVERELWNYKLLLIAILLLLTGEWFIRRRRGMV